MPTRCRCLPVLCLIALLAGSVLAPSARAERLPWDQAEVIKRAQRLEVALAVFLSDPGVEAHQRSAVQQRRQHSAVASVRELERRTRELVRMLRTDHGFEQTEPLWRQMLGVREDIRWYARDSELPETTRAKAERAREALMALAPFYAED